MKLELKHLAPYLPHRLKAENCFNEIVEVKGIQFGNESCNNVLWTFVKNGDYLQGYIYQCKPILRPLSDIFKLIDWDNNNEPYMIGYKYGVEKVKEDGVEFYADEYYADYAESPKCYIDITSFNWWLFEHHFDVFGLIEQGLAIDINTLKDN